MKKTTRKIANLLCSVGFLSCCVPFSSQAMISGGAGFSGRTGSEAALGDREKWIGAMNFLESVIAPERSIKQTCPAKLFILPSSMRRRYSAFNVQRMFGTFGVPDAAALGELKAFFEDVIAGGKRDLHIREMYEENTAERCILTCFLDDLSRTAKKRRLKNFDDVCKYGYEDFQLWSNPNWVGNAAQCFLEFQEALHSRISGLDDESAYYMLSEAGNVYEKHYFSGEKTNDDNVNFFDVCKAAFGDSEENIKTGLTLEQLEGNILKCLKNTDYSALDYCRAAEFFHTHQDEFLEHLAEKCKHRR